MTMLKTYRRRAKRARELALRGRWIFPFAFSTADGSVECGIEVARFPTFRNYTFTYQNPASREELEQRLREAIANTDFTKPLQPLRVPKP